MLRFSNIKLPVGSGAEDALAFVLRRHALQKERVKAYRIGKLSVDARDKTRVCLVFALDVSFTGDEGALLKSLPNGAAAAVKPIAPIAPARLFAPARPPVVVGMGPCGLFAALYLARAGLCPVVLERGRKVDERRQSVARFFADGTLDPESNVQFGEGGAGAFSDGKLTTGIKDARCAGVLHTLVEHGAPQEILYLAHPHIGTDNLPRVVASIRDEIERLGGRVLFGARLTDVLIEKNAVRGISYRDDAGAHELSCDALITALGHSARDTLQMLFSRGVVMVQKPFSAGVRIEQRQRDVNRAQYGAFAEKLGAAEYHLSCRLRSGRGAYTFCMCPGGSVIAAASQEGGVCVNGMSEFARNGENANAALLVDVRTEDFEDDHPLAGLVLQRQWEQRAFVAGGGGYKAPVQRAEDFRAKRESKRLGDIAPTYRPGVTCADLRAVLPAFICEGLCDALSALDAQMRGFACPDAVLTGVETRSSSPVRVPRSDAYQANIAGLYPAGEGAGYAGGIMSAAVDGLRAAEAVARDIAAQG